MLFSGEHSLGVVSVAANWFVTAAEGVETFMKTMREYVLWMLDSV